MNDDEHHWVTITNVSGQTLEIGEGRKIMLTFPSSYLTEADVRRIVREELDKYKWKWTGESSIKYYEDK